MIKLSYVFCIFFFQMYLVYSCTEEIRQNGTIEHTYIGTGSRLHHTCWIIKNPYRADLYIEMRRLNLQNRPASVGSVTLNLISESRVLEYWSESRLDNFTTTSAEVEIYFKIDEARFGRGRIASFELYYKKTCDKVYTELTGNISSPLYPNNYWNEAFCTYQIILNPGYLINFTVHDMQLEDTSACDFDYLQIYDVDYNHQDQAVLKICGIFVPDPFISTYNRLKVIFRSDEEYTFKGFYAMYTAIPVDTGTEIPPMLTTYQPTNHDMQEHNATEIAETSKGSVQFTTAKNDLKSEAENEKSCSSSNGTDELSKSNSNKMEFDEHQLRMEILELQKQFETERIEFQRNLENERLKKLKFEFENLKIMFTNKETKEASFEEPKANQSLHAIETN